jgi:predicted lipase
MEQYKEYLFSAMLANVSYNTSDQLTDIWIKTKNSNKDNISNIFSGVEKIPEFYNDNETGAYAFSILKEKTLYVIFRGTNDSQDVVIDLNFILISFIECNKKCKVHRGFLKQFSAIKDPILKTIVENANNIENIIFIGHSLGGALAILFTGYVASLYPKIKVSCHTFGSPRVGNKHYVKWFQNNVSCSNCVRITNQNDPVTQIPISGYFQHVSIAKCMMNNLTVKDLPDKKFLARLANLQINCCKPVLAHSCQKYIENLMKLYDQSNIEELTISIRV